MKPIHSQRGAAALGVTLLLLFVLTLVVGFAGRNLLFEQRSAANQARSTQAFEAAEAGLAWAQALLNSGEPIDAHCEPSAAPGDLSLRERFLRYDGATRQFAPRTWVNAGVAVALQAACVLDADGWRCSCPSGSHPVLAAPAATGAHAAFTLQFVAVPRRGVVRLVATGCDRFAPACLPGMTGAPAGDATARLQVLLGLLPALATPPAAALSARGDIAADGAIALANTDADSGGLTAQAGGAIALAHAGLTTLPGRPGPGSLAAADAQFASATAERLRARLLGLDAVRWQSLPGLGSVDCPGECTSALAEAIGPGTAHPMLHVSGDLLLDGPASFGSIEKPLLLVVEGQVRLRGGVRIHGLIVTLAPSWDTSGSENAQVQGAVVALGAVTGNGTPTIVRDAQVLARLNGEVGTFAPVPGSWRDF